MVTKAGNTVYRPLAERCVEYCVSYRLQYLSSFWYGIVLCLLILDPGQHCVISVKYANNVKDRVVIHPPLIWGRVADYHQSSIKENVKSQNNNLRDDNSRWALIWPICQNSLKHSEKTQCIWSAVRWRQFHFNEAVPYRMKGKVK